MRWELLRRPALWEWGAVPVRRDLLSWILGLSKRVRAPRVCPYSSGVHGEDRGAGHTCWIWAEFGGPSPPHPPTLASCSRCRRTSGAGTRRARTGRSRAGGCAAAATSRPWATRTAPTRTSAPKCCPGRPRGETATAAPPAPTRPGPSKGCCLPAPSQLCGQQRGHGPGLSGRTSGTSLSPLTAPSLLTALSPLTAALPSAAAPSPVPARCQGTWGDMAMLGFWGGPAAAATCRLWGEEACSKGDE